MTNAGTMIYAGYLRPGETSLQRLRAFESLGMRVTPVDMLFRHTVLRRLGYRAANALFRRGVPVRLPDFSGVNRRLVQLASSGESFDWLWLDKPLTVNPETLALFRRYQPKARLVAFAPDDMAARHNQSRQFTESLSLLDAFVTTKSYNVSELKALGCLRVVFMDNGFDPETHHPVDVGPERKSRIGGGVGFIGSYEKIRAASLLALAENGIPVRVWGGVNWRQCRLSHPNLKLEYKELMGAAYAQAICAFDINLCFLRKLNRDLQTTRSVEIPACGAFMLAERSDEHRRLFEEDREAVFFGDDRELVGKCRHYLDHPAERQRIAEAGYRRCQGGYSYPRRLQAVLGTLKTGAT
jgi:spore maturation protein CgeB